MSISLAVAGAEQWASGRRRWRWPFGAAAPITRGQRVVGLVMLICCLNVYDLIISIWAAQGGLLNHWTESNPIAAYLLACGPVALVIYKVLLVGGGTGILLLSRHRAWVEVAAVAMAVVYAFVTLQWFDFVRSDELVGYLTLLRDEPFIPHPLTATMDYTMS